MNRSFLDLKLATFFFSCAFVLLGVAGCLRYGGPSGVAQRVQREVGTLMSPPREHPNLVPTALPAVSNSAALDAAVLITETNATTTTLPTVSQVEESTEATHLTETDAPTATPTPWTIPATASLSGIRHAWQTWNNCGPATLSMQMSYFGNVLESSGGRLGPAHVRG